MSRDLLGQATYWVIVVWMAVAAGLLAFLLVYLNVPFPLWEFFRPPPGLPEGPAEWRMFRVSIGIGAIVTLASMLTAVWRNRTR